MPLTTKAMLRCLILGAAGGVAGLVLFAAPAYADDDTQPPGGCWEPSSRSSRSSTR